MTQGNELFLRRRPLWHQHVDHRIPSGHHVTRRKRIGALDEAAGARLQHSHITIIEGQHAGDLQRAVERAAGDAGQAHAEVLLDAWLDAHRWRAVVGVNSVGVPGYQLHIHKWRFARRIEVLLRNHWVVPVERFALWSSGNYR